jgi:hypothetical protein
MAGKGRQKGQLNKATREIKAAAQRLVTDPAYIKSLKDRLLKGRAPQMEILLHYYAYGKPRDRVEHSGSVTMPAQVIFELHRTETTVDVLDPDPTRISH